MMVEVVHAFIAQATMFCLLAAGVYVAEVASPVFDNVSVDIAIEFGNVIFGQLSQFDLARVYP